MLPENQRAATSNDTQSSRAYEIIATRNDTAPRTAGVQRRIAYPELAAAKRRRAAATVAATSAAARNTGRPVMAAYARAWSISPEIASNTGARKKRQVP